MYDGGKTAMPLSVGGNVKKVDRPVWISSWWDMSVKCAQDTSSQCDGGCTGLTVSVILYLSLICKEEILEPLILR